jgi:threonine aldolase
MTPVDLRSDTVTRPTGAMREAMLSAPLGDDVFRDDPSVLALEEAAAARLGKAAALFVPSGTMANQIALRVHTRHGDEVIAHKRSHIFNYESGAPGALAGVVGQLVDSEDGGLPELAAHIHQTDDPHFANTTLICLENTHNGCGGVILDPAHVAGVAAQARQRGIALHLDGARLFNAAVASGRPAAALAAHFDTVSVCLSKGLGAPAGSVLAGDRRSIKRALRYRKMYGGAMRQAGVLAAAGLYALEHHVDRLADDHRRARALAEGLDALPGLSVDLERVQTNLIYFSLDPAHPVGGGEALVAALAAEGVLITGGVHRLRACTHLDVDDAGLERALKTFARVMGA